MSAANTVAPVVCTILCLSYVDVTRLQAAAQARQARACPGFAGDYEYVRTEQSWESDGQALDIF